MQFRDHHFGAHLVECHEIVLWVLGAKIPRYQCLVLEVLQVERDNQLRLSADGSSQDMPITFVVCKHGNQLLEIRNKCLRKSPANLALPIIRQVRRPRTAEPFRVNHADLIQDRTRENW